jgi:hypothetical protein
MRTATCFVLAALVTLAEASALAQNPAPSDVAKARYNAATEALNGRRYGEAALGFEGAAAAQMSSLALFTAAQSWEYAGYPDRACDAYARAIAAGLAPDQQPIAEGRVRALEAVLGRAEITAPVEGWFVQLDGNTEQTAPATLHGTPGLHALYIRAPGKPLARKVVHLDVGQVEKVELSAQDVEGDSGALAAAPAPSNGAPATSSAKAAATAPAPSSGASVRKTIGFVAIGVGLASVATSAFLWVQARDARDQFNAAPTQQRFDYASSLQDWTNLELLAGGVLTIAGAVLVFWPSGKSEGQVSASASAPKVMLQPTLGGAALRGTF